MDFRQTTQPSTDRPTAPVAAPAVTEPKTEKREPKVAKGKKSVGWLGFLGVVMLIGIAVLLVGITIIFMRSHSTTSADDESKYVATSQYQAVFLNNGQVYFGHINDLNQNYIRLTNIYYLTQTGDSTSSNYSLVKLGCQQIHDPTDQMVVNRSQVTFWENLDNDGKVVSSIKQYQTQSKGESTAQLCSQVSNQTQAGTTTTQGGSSTATK